MKILVTGGTVFASKFAAEYFCARGDEVFVLNRGSRRQPEGCVLIQADRHSLGEVLRGKKFDCVLDITAYTAQDVCDLLDSGVEFDEYVLLSSSAVYPETNAQPFCEDQVLGRNLFWSDYGVNKIEAENVLKSRVHNAYIVRPPYLYGPGNNVYREAFVFECADLNRKFYLPRDGKMKLQFFHIRDLCRVFEAILKTKSQCHIFNVGNERAVSVREWVNLCYKAAGKVAEFVQVPSDVPQRKYFPFYDYEYFLNVENQQQILNNLEDLEAGLRESYEWYSANKDCVKKKDFIEFIEGNF